MRLLKRRAHLLILQALRRAANPLKALVLLKRGRIRRSKRTRRRRMSGLRNKRLRQLLRARSRRRKRRRRRTLKMTAITVASLD
jgi:hypothetical protein